MLAVKTLGPCPWFCRLPGSQDRLAAHGAKLLGGLAQLSKMRGLATKPLAMIALPRWVEGMPNSLKWYLPA